MYTCQAILRFAMSAKGAWARKGGAQLFPQQVPATENSEQAIPPANLASENSTNPKPVATEPLEKLDPNVDQEHAETITNLTFP